MNFSALALGVTMLLRFAAGIVVYVVIAAVVIACVAGTIFLWFVNQLYFCNNNFDRGETSISLSFPVLPWQVHSV